MVSDVLKKMEHNGQPLSAATAVGQFAGLFVKNQEVAQRTMIEQPASFTILEPNNEPVSLGVSTTKTQALIEIDTVLVPNCIVAHRARRII